jgi:hypothetical protein
VTTFQNDSYSGDSSYKYVDKLIKNSDRELMIVSPYISDYYTKMLMNKAKSKRVRVLTSESAVNYKDSLLNNYVSKSAAGYMKALAFIFILVLITLYLKFDYIALLLTLVVLLLAVFGYRKHEKIQSNMQVKVVKSKFVHEKLYISSHMAIVGSANLTYNGMHRNVEHIDVVRDVNRIGELRDHFEHLWNNN